MDRRRGSTLFLALLIWSIEVIVVKADERMMVEGTNKFNSSGNFEEIVDLISNLVKVSEELRRKVSDLEDKVEVAEGRIVSLNKELQFLHPTSEKHQVRMAIDDWRERESVSYEFEAGSSMGLRSKWAFNLIKANGTLSLHLQLMEEPETRPTVLFASFTLQILNSSQTSFRNLTVSPCRDLLKTKERIISLTDAILLSEIEDPSSDVLRNDSLTLNLRFELIGRGEKLYKTWYEEQVSSDRQTVEFEVATWKLGARGEGAGRVLAFSRFLLLHPWNKIGTEWRAEISVPVHNHKSLTFNLALTNTQFPWPQLFASHKLTIYHRSQIILQRNGELHDFMERSLIVPEILSEEMLDHLLEDKKNETILFKLSLTIFGQDAKYYVHHF